MGLFSRLFAKPNDMVALRKAIAQQRYADVLLIVGDIDDSELNDEERNELQQGKVVAGDSLARINLDEGLFLLRDDQPESAIELLQLAQQQAVSTELQQQVNQALASYEPAQQEEVAPTGGCSSCSSCNTAGASDGQADLVNAEDLPDFATQLELVLVGYPEDYAQRYRHKSDPFHQAFLLAHQGDEQSALEQFQQLDDEHDDLYNFEVGSLLARLGSHAKAETILQAALAQNPDHLLAVETLVMVLMAQNKSDDAIELVQHKLCNGSDPAFCHAQLCSIYHLRQQDDLVLGHGQQAIEAGQRDPRIIITVASLLEQDNQLERAEKLLTMLSGGGCGGGPNLYLAEFLLRQKRDLRQILDVFNGACRQEPDNPRWQLRVAQTYFANGWDKRGLELLTTVVNDPRLSEELRQEGQALLDERS